MLFAKYYIDTEIINIYLKNNKFYGIDNNNKKKIYTKLSICSEIANSWDGNHGKIKVEKKHNKFIAICPIVIYDWISMELFGYGNSSKEVINDVENRYKECINYYELFKKNLERNKKEFFSRIHKFAFLPINRTYSDVHDKHLPKSELIYFEDNDLNFRQNAINNGIPSDARADDPIFGYIDGNKIVFHKFGFIKDSFHKKEFLETIDKNYEIIAKHYNLEDYEVYENSIDIYRYGTDENNNLKDSLIFEDFDYYLPIKKKHIIHK